VARPRSRSFGDMMAANSFVVLGLIAAPGAANDVAGELEADLPDRLAGTFPEVTWRIERLRDALVDPPALDTEIIAVARERLLAHGWDLTVCLTDLPLRAERRPVVAHASASHAVALICLPALGPVNMGQRSADTAVQMIARLLGASEETDPRTLGRRLNELGGDSPDGGSVRFTAHVLAGNARLLLGMIAANRPWGLALGLSRALVAALAAVVFALVTPDLWRIADEAGPIRAGVLAALAVAVPTVTAIANAHLWERASNRRAREQIVLFNITTLMTIAIGFATLFVALFALTVLGALLLVPSNLFAATVGHRLSSPDLAHLALVASSLAAFAGALGAGLESDDAIRTAAYRSWPDARTEQEARLIDGEA